jgi:hypothetical protein
LGGGAGGKGQRADQGSIQRDIADSFVHVVRILRLAQRHGRGQLISACQIRLEKDRGLGQRYSGRKDGGTKQENRKPRKTGKRRGGRGEEYSISNVQGTADSRELWISRIPTSFSVWTDGGGVNVQYSEALAKLRAALWQESIQMSEVSRQNVAMGGKTVQRLFILNSGF